MFSILKDSVNGAGLVGRDLPSVQGCIGTLEQGRDCLNNLTDKQYLLSAKPHVSSSIGEHYRHWLDLYHAIFNACTNHQSSDEKPLLLDYNQRRRGHMVESSRSRAMAEIQQFISWLESMTEEEVFSAVTVITEVSMTYQKSESMTSTLERELTFVALHADHHFAMIKVVMSLFDIKADDSFGFAPTTLSYLREQ